jgi:hypothetical protein
MFQQWIVLTMGAAGILGGCASVTQVEAGRHDRFRNALVESCRSIKTSDFPAARGHLRQASSLARGDEQIAKVTDLKLVCRGAEAMNSGRPADAADSWLAIQDSSVKNQLVGLANEEGIDLVVLATARQASEEVKP